MNAPIGKRPPWVFEISLFLCLAQSLIPTEMKINKFDKLKFFQADHLTL